MLYVSVLPGYGVSASRAYLADLENDFVDFQLIEQVVIFHRFRKGYDVFKHKVQFALMFRKGFERLFEKT